MKKENIVKTIAASLGFVILLFVLQSLVPLIYQSYYSIAYSELRTTDYEAFTEQVMALIQANTNLFNVISFVLFLVVVIVIFRVKKENLLTRIRWNPVPKQTYALAGVFAIFFLLAFNLLSEVLLPQAWVQGAEEYTVMVSGDIFYNIMFVVILGPLVEEILMRGLMTTRLLGRLPLWVAVAFPAILFGLGHAAGGMGQIVGTTALGLLFALIFIWTNSLRTAFFAHALNNCLVMIMLWSEINVDISTPVQLILGIITLAICVYVGSLIYKRRIKEI